MEKYQVALLITQQSNTLNQEMVVNSLAVMIAASMVFILTYFVYRFWIKA